MKRILIIGDPGSGKNYLANILSKRLKLRIYDLDDLRYKRRFDIPMPLNLRYKKLRILAKRRKWILAGVPYEWVGEALKRAELIIILREKFLLESVRIIRRFIKRKLSGSTDKETIRDVIKLIRWDYDDFHKKGAEKKAMYRHIQNKYGKKIVLLRSKADVRKFLDNLIS